MPLAESAPASAPERIETIIIGGDQAGLSVGYQLARRGLRFVILDAGERIGDCLLYTSDLSLIHI